MDSAYPITNPPGVTPFEEDKWDIQSCQLEAFRTVYNHRRWLNFTRVRDSHNRFLMKIYIRHFLFETTVLLTTIDSRFGCVARSMNLVEQPITAWTKQDADFVAGEIVKRYPNKNTRVTRMMEMQQFINYMVQEGYLQDNPMKHLKALARFGGNYYPAPTIDQGDFLHQATVASSMMEIPVVPQLSAEGIKAYDAYLQAFAKAQRLANGICALPVSHGSCVHGGGCMACPEFRTSPRFLPLHRSQLRRVEDAIKLAEDKGWLPQLETNRLLQGILLKLIPALEEMEDPDAYTNPVSL